MLPNQKNAFSAFYNSARHNEVLGEKTTLLVHLAASMAVACYPCMRYYLEQMDDAGISEDEIGAVEAIVMTVSAERVREQFNEALTGEESGGCGAGEPC